MTDRSRPPPGPDRRNRTAERDRQVAIALSHDIGSDHAPTVVAKGYGEVAEQILRLALDNDVKVRNDPAQIGRASCRERVCQYGSPPVVAGTLKKKKKRKK